ncbi:MAG: VanW family protein, partial [Firmicutes bacterium]|nr:VanW family protein [Bacillota bacterium]
MYYRGNQPPQNRPQSANQWNNIQQQGAQPADFQRGGYPPPMPGKPGKKRSLRWQLIKLLLVLLLVGAVGAGIYVGKAYLDVKPYTSVFLNGVFVDGIDLGGLTWEEGNAAVRDQISQELGSWYVRLKNANAAYPDITAETLNIRRDPTQALEAAWAIGHETSTTDRKTVFELQQELQQAMANTYSFSSVAYDADTSPIDDILAKLQTAAYKAPQNAKMLSFNPESTSEPFTFQQEVVGRRLDVDTLRTQIMEMVNNFESGEILMQTEAIQPDITVAELEKLYTLRARAVTPIDSHSSEQRNANIKRAFEKINNLNLSDGAKFSFNGTVGRRTLENGFYRAYEY